MSNVGKELRKAGEELREAGLRAAMSLELFVVTWKWMRKITGTQNS